VSTTSNQLQTITENGIAEFSNNNFAPNEKAFVAIDDSAFEPYFKEFTVQSYVHGTIELLPKRSLSIQYVLQDNTPVDGLIVYVVKGIQLVGRGITNQDGYVTVYLRDEINPEDLLTVYMADPDELLDEHSMQVEAPYDNQDVVITLNEQISGGFFKKIKKAFKKVTHVVTKVINVPGKLIKTVMTKIPGVSKAL